MDTNPRCNKRLSYLPRDPETGSIIIGTIKTEICNGVLVLKERIVHDRGVDFVYVCPRCGARKIFINVPPEDEAGCTRKSFDIQEAEEKAMEANK